MKTSKNKPIFIRNKKRALRAILGKENIWTPEHERLGIKPIKAKDMSGDFMNERIKKGPPVLGSRKPPAQRKTSAINPTQPEQAWLHAQPPQEPESDYATGDIADDEVPYPPPNKFEHSHPALGVDLSGILPGQYCLIYDNGVWPANSTDDIEEVIEQVMRADPNVQEDDFIIIKRLFMKVGVSIAK